ncbi:MAG: hypothetical protein KF795_31360 [Labilithrix sp.]|nr:hypothetical protein [Labilithrix sp.]
MCAGVATFAVTQGCGSDSDNGGGGTAAQTGKTVPAEEGDPTTATEERVFALNSISLGEADRAGNKNKDAWKGYGYNLDGLITSVSGATSPDLERVCKRAQGAPATVHQDGDEGTDNTFGKEILKLLDPFTPTPSKSITEALVAGDFTIMLKVVGLNDDAAQTNTGLSGTLLVGGKFSEDKAPTFTTADDWPYNQDPQVGISGAYINKGVFVNGTGGASVKLSLSISGQSLSLTINKAIISFKHNPGTKSLEEGTIAGVINTEEFVNGISAVAGRFSTDLCSGSTVEGIKGSIRQASDMLADGSQDPTKSCDGISIGIGFTAKQVGSPTKIVPPSEAPPDPCDPNANPDGGT